MMISIDLMEKKLNDIFQANFREAVIAQLRAEGTPAPFEEATADSLIAVMARAVAPSVIERLPPQWDDRMVADTHTVLTLDDIGFDSKYTVVDLVRAARGAFLAPPEGNPPIS